MSDMDNEPGKDSGACSICGKEAVISRKHEGRALCRRHFSESLDSLFRKNIRHSGALVRGASVAVEADGGDSPLFLVHEMAKICAMRKDLKVTYFMIKRDDATDDPRVCAVRRIIGEGAKIEFIDSVVDACHDGGCDDARMATRRMEIYALSRAAAEEGIGRLILADTLDDAALETTCFYFGKTDCGDCCRNHQVDMETEIIRPLENIQSHEIRRYLEVKNISAIVADDSKSGTIHCFSTSVGRMLDELEARHSGLKFNILKSRDKMGQAHMRR